MHRRLRHRAEGCHQLAATPRPPAPASAGVQLRGGYASSVHQQCVTPASFELWEERSPTDSVAINNPVSAFRQNNS